MVDLPEKPGVDFVKQVNGVIIPQAPQVIGKLIKLIEVFRVTGIYEYILKVHTFDSLDHGTSSLVTRVSSPLRGHAIIILIPIGLRGITYSIISPLLNSP